MLLAIEVWRYSPIEGALLMTALPAGMLLARTLSGGAPGPRRRRRRAPARRRPRRARRSSPASGRWFAGIALALCGVGFDLVGDVLGPEAVPPDAPAVRAATASVGARHAGLVLGLVLIAPVLSSSLEAGVDRATLGATRSMLEAELELRDKLPVTWALRTAIEEAPRGQVPDLEAVFDERGADDDDDLAAARDGLIDTVTDAITRSFRPAFFVAAAARRGGRSPCARREPAPTRSRLQARSTRTIGAAIGVAAVAAIGVALIASEFADGAGDVGEYEAAGPVHGPTRHLPGRRPRRDRPADRAVGAQRRGV